MRGMILAAGRGSRMGDLTQKTPKPLLRVGGKFLIEYALDRFQKAGIREIVINLHYLGDQIKAALGDGSRYGVAIAYAEEQEVFDVAGGIINALPLLGNDNFIVMSGDIITDYALKQLKIPEGKHAHLIMVDNPCYHPEGDFGIVKDHAHLQALPRFTFANLGIYSSAIFKPYVPGNYPWREIMLPLIADGKVTAEHYNGLWFNVGTPQDLSQANKIKLALELS